MYTWVLCYDGFTFGVTEFEYKNMAWIKCHPSLKEFCEEGEYTLGWTNSTADIF